MGEEMKELIPSLFGFCWLKTGWSKRNAVDISILSHKQKLKQQL